MIMGAFIGDKARNTAIVLLLFLMLLAVYVGRQGGIEGVFHGDYETADLAEYIKQMCKNRNNAIITGDVTMIEPLYDRSTKYGVWAYQHEITKMKYVQNWGQKQGVKFTEIIPTIKVRSIKPKGDRFTVNLMCSTEYRYVYENEPGIVNSSRIGTYHVLDLLYKDEAWVITREWYKDPFEDILNLGRIKVDSINQFISTHAPRDLTNIGDRRKNAVLYAEMYCGAASEEKYGFQYNKKYRNYNSQGGDCANFASQILYEGGKFRKNHMWNYNGKGATRAWLNADGFKNYMLHSGRASLIAYGNYEKVYKASYKLLPGDFVAYEKGGDITHISVVTGADSKGYSLVTCHNTDRYNVPWDLGWSSTKVRFWLVRVHY